MSEFSSSPLSRRNLIKAATLVPVKVHAASAATARQPSVAMQAAHLSHDERFASSSIIKLNINERNYSLEVSARTTLLDLLREQLQLTGAKKGCNRGECGACTVLLDGRRVNACLVLAPTLDGRTVTTIEGLATDGKLHPLQTAFISYDAFQCGFCTSGQIMSGVGCIREGHTSSNSEIREWMSGNLCRCAAYPQIAQAIEAVAKGGV